MPAYEKSDLERRMHGAVEALKHDLQGLRTGRASTSLLDPVHVEVYGANMPLNLGTLRSGQMRELTKVELGQLLTISRAADTGREGNDT